jgi:hypothetical protein
MLRKKPKLMALGVIAVAVTSLCVLDAGSAFAYGNGISITGRSDISELDALNKAQNQCPPTTHNHRITSEDSGGGGDTGWAAWWSVTVDC